jgi:predicted double-glycine peptidase
MELRQQQVVIQQWDLSCGAAALATVLRYQHGEDLSEREIALALMSRPEYLATPELVQYREGFSLLDMKRFVDGLGYNGVGLGNLTLATGLDRAPPDRPYPDPRLQPLRGPHRSTG